MSVLTIKYFDDDVDVEFEYSKGHNGSFYEPPEYENLEIIKVTYEGKVVNLIVDMEIIEELLWEAIDEEKRNN